MLIIKIKNDQFYWHILLYHIFQIGVSNNNNSNKFRETVTVWLIFDYIFSHRNKRWTVNQKDIIATDAISFSGQGLI